MQREENQHIWNKYYHKKSAPKINLNGAQNIYESINQAFQKYPTKPALSCMGTEISFEHLNRMVNRFSCYLKHVAGIKKGDRVAVMLPNIIQFPISFLALQKVGAICVSTNPLYTTREMKHQFVDSGVTAIIIVDLFADKLQEIIKETAIKHVIVTSIADQFPIWKAAPLRLVFKFKKMVPAFSLPHTSFVDAMRQGRDDYTDIEHTSLDDVALLQYTGGTTGKSKGAMLTHGNILSNMDQIRFVTEEFFVEAGETVLTALPLYHIFCMTVNFLAFLRLGQHMILVPKPVPIENTVKMFEKYDITIMTGVNTLYNALNNSKKFQELAPRTIKIAIAGGMALQEPVSQAFQKITGVKILEGYGLTESSPVTHVNIPGRMGPVGSMGVPLIGTDCKIFMDDGTEAPIGEVGEVCIQGPQVMKGYWKQDEETSKVIRNGWLWTGDLGKVDANGYFYIVDRKKDMILVSGFNVYPNEVEEVLMSHPKVLEAAVVGTPDKGSGEAVRAFIVRKDPSLTEAELREYCKEQLTGYKRPRSFEFKDSLPKTNVGKILRRELRT